MKGPTFGNNDSALRMFIDDEAEVDDNEEEEEEDSEEDLEDFVVDDSVDSSPNAKESDDGDAPLFGHEHISSMFHFDVSEDERVSVDNLKRTADAIVERARKRRSLGGSLIAKETTADAEPQLHMYIVKCKRGQESRAAKQLVYSHKLNVKNSSNSTDHSSSVMEDVFNLPFTSGKLYVIADSLLTVRNACQREQGTIHKISYTYSTFQLVPPTEARRVTLIRNGVKSLRRRKMRGTWVKLANHATYKGDFAIVLDTDGADGGEVHTSGSQEHFDVLVVPRVAFKHREHGPLIRRYDDVQIETVPFEKRPTPNFFTYDDALLRFGASAIKLEAFDMFSVAGQRFYSGMHVITVNRNDVDEHSKPAATDVQTFMQTGTRDMDIINRSFLRVRDKVRVIEGEYTSCIGRVLSRGRDTVFIYAFGADGRGREIELAIGQVERVFGINDWVRIMMGDHRNTVGVVTTVSEEELTLACNSKDDPADVLKVRDPHFRIRATDKGKQVSSPSSSMQDGHSVTGTSDVPKVRELTVLTVPQSYVETFDVSVPIIPLHKKYDETEQFAKHQPVYIMSGPLKGVAELKYCNDKEAMVFCPDGRGYQVTDRENIVLSTTWRTAADRVLDRLMMKKAKERIAKYEADGPRYVMNLRLAMLDTRINRPAIIMEGPLKGCVGDLLSVGRKSAMIYVDAKSEHIQQVSIRFVVSCENWKFLDGRNVSVESVPALMKTLSLHNGTTLVIRPRATTPPVENDKDVGPPNDGGSPKDGASTNAQLANRTTTGAVWAFNPSIKALMSRYHVCFRLANSFSVPSDRGRMAWSLAEPKIVKEMVAGREVEVYGVPVRYKPRSGDAARDQFVDVQHLRECGPLLKNEAVCIRGDAGKVGQVVYVQSWPESDEIEDRHEESSKLPKPKGKEPRGKEIRVRLGSSSARGAKYFMLPVHHVTLIKPYGSM